VVLGEEKATALLHFWLRYATTEVSVFRVRRLSALLLQLQDTQTMSTGKNGNKERRKSLGPNLSHRLSASPLDNPLTDPRVVIPRC